MYASRALAVLALLAATAALAQDDQLTYDLPSDLAVTAGALAVWGGTALAKGSLAPAACRVCGVPALDAWTRERVVWDHRASAQAIFDGMAYVALPVSAAAVTLAAAHDRGERWSNGFTDLLLVTEAVALAGAVSQLVKFPVGRQRPYVHYGNYREADRLPKADDNLSFYSGHSSLAFSLTLATSTVLRLRGDPAAPWVLGIGLGASTAVGWLSIASDRHYLTDALAGALMGSVIGWGVPWLVHRSSSGTGNGTPATSRRGAVTPLPIAVAFAF